MTAKAKVHTTAKPAKGAKPAAHKTTAHKARTTTAKTTAAHKAHKPSAKHTVTKKVHAKRGYAIDGLPVCAVEAVAQSLRLAGQPVSADEVAWLWELAGGRELSIGEALQAAARFGLGGCRPLAGPAHEERGLPPLVVVSGQFPGRGDRHVMDEDAGQHLGDLRHADQGADAVEVLAEERHGNRAVAVADRLDVDEELRGLGGFGEPLDGRVVLVPEVARDVHVPVAHALILGVDRPGPHCVLATADGWWSWGQLYSPWACAIEEAWPIGWEEKKSAPWAEPHLITLPGRIQAGRGRPVPSLAGDAP